MGSKVQTYILGVVVNPLQSGEFFANKHRKEKLTGFKLISILGAERNWTDEERCIDFESVEQIENAEWFQLIITPRTGSIKFDEIVTDNRCRYCGLSNGYGVPSVFRRA